MEGREFRHEFGSLRRWALIHSRREWRLRVGRGDSQKLSRKGSLHTAESAQQKRVGQMSEKAFSYPVIANGRLYIRDLELLWVYDIKAK